MITGVAIRNENILISLPKPNRHHDCFRYCQEVLGIKDRKLQIGGQFADQGFITDKGVYLDRNQAMRHVRRCQQELMPIQKGRKRRWKDILFSEDLW